MAQVTVVYDDLKSTSTNLVSVGEYVDKAIKQLEFISGKLETAMSHHGNVFSQTEYALLDMEKAFGNYKEVVGFMKKQCDDAYEAFSNAEDQASSDAKKLTEKQQKVVASAAAMLGLKSFDAKNAEADIYGGRAELPENKKFDKSTLGQRTKTWQNVFEETEDGDNRTNAIESNYGTSLLDDSDDKSKDTSTDTDGDTKTNSDSETETETNSTDNSGSEDYSSSSGGGGGYSSGGGGGGSSSGGTQRRVSPKTSDYDFDGSNKKAEEARKSAENQNKNKQATPEKTTEEKIDEVDVDNKKTDTENKEGTSTPDNKDSSTTPESTDAKTDNNPQSDITTPPSETESVKLQPAPAPAPAQTTGGSYSGNQGYSSSSGDYSGNYAEAAPATSEDYNSTEGAPVPEEDGVETDISSIEDVVKSNDYTKIPSSTEPLTSSSSKSGGSSVIPIAAGLSAAAAAGIGAKAYMDRKRNNADEDDFESEEWTGDESMDIEYEDQSAKEEYLDDSDDYGYQDAVTEKYGARNNEELADLQ